MIEEQDWNSSRVYEQSEAITLILAWSPIVLWNGKQKHLCLAVNQNISNAIVYFCGPQKNNLGLEWHKCELS